MKLHAFEMPDDPTQLPAWLERYLVGPDLGKLVAELMAVRGDVSSDSRTLNDVLGKERRLLLEHGMAALSAETQKQFLLRPRLLLDLQALVHVDGGAHWRRAGLPQADLQGIVERGRHRLDAFLAGESRHPGAEPHNMPSKGVVSWYRRPTFATLAAAAGIMLALFIGWQFGPARSRQALEEALARGNELERQLTEEREKRQQAEQRVSSNGAGPSWGWGKSGALPEKGSATAYLNRLADVAGEWFDKRPDSVAGLAKRVLEFRQGCDVLIFAEHRPLSTEDKQWLVRKCRLWAMKLDKHLEALEAGEDAARIRVETDETIRKLVESLRARAKDMAG